MSRNLMHDHRVSQEREEAFGGFVKPPCTTDGLNRALVDYFEKKVRTRTLPHYVYRAINANNLLSGRGLLPVIHKDVKLVRVLDISGLTLVYQWAKDRKRKKRAWKVMLAKFPIDPSDDEIAKWLDDKIVGASPKQVKQFIATILDILNSYSGKSPFQPTWATTWAALEPYKTDGPDRWLEAMGVFKPTPRWVILLRYTVGEAGTIARPTVLDAGWYAYHFPSPPQASLADGGHPMDLRISPRATLPLPEYVHKQIHHRLTHWTDLGGKIGRTMRPFPTALADQRWAHHELLAETYGVGLYGWMNSPI